MILNSSTNSYSQARRFGRFFVDDLFTKAIIKSSLIYVFRLVFFFIARRDFETPITRFVFLTPPALRQQIVYDRILKRMIRFQARNIDDLTTASQVFRFSSYETRHLKRRDDILAFYRAILEEKRTPLIVDCGGNIGLASLFFAYDYDKAKVICIEPDRENITQARVNNKDLDVDFIEAAIGSESGTADIINPDASNNGFQVEKNSGGRITVITFENILERYSASGTVPFLVKIDIEGFEADLFAQNTDWIDKFPVIMIELHDWMLVKSASTKPFLQAISTRDRDFIIVGESIFSIANHFPDLTKKLDTDSLRP